MSQLPPIPPSFAAKKSAILVSLAVPSSSYSDLSPKGSVDEAIVPLIEKINLLDGAVTTSSCSGRVSVFLEGRKLDESSEVEQPGEVEGSEDEGRSQQIAVPGGKGIGGRWLFVSHDPVDLKQFEGNADALTKLCGMLKWAIGADDIAVEISNKRRLRLVRFQFEPMILHILTASLAHASPVLAAALNAGFRESGIQSLKNLEDPTVSFPMVAIRTSGLAFESLVGFVMENEHSEEGKESIQSLVSDATLRLLLDISNARFNENRERTQRFEAELSRRTQRRRADWEDAESRRLRKRAEGLAKRDTVKENKGRNDDQERMKECQGMIDDLGEGVDVLGILS